MTAILALLLIAPGSLAQDTTELLVEVTRDSKRICPKPVCQSYFFRRADMKMLTCTDGTLAARCYAADIRWGLLRLDAQTLATTKELALEGEFLLAVVREPYSWGGAAPLEHLIVVGLYDMEDRDGTRPLVRAAEL